MIGAFVGPPIAPQRTAVHVTEADGRQRTVLMMTAVRIGGIATSKVVTVISGEGGGVHSHLLAVAADGAILAMIDGHELTARRTAAASVLAARALAKRTPRVLAVLGAGRQARAQAEAFCACFTIELVRIWARRTDAARDLASFISSHCAHVTVAATPGDAVRGADLVTAATMSQLPLVRSVDVVSGCHVDLVGGFRPDMREADDALMARAMVVTDGAPALNEAGDLVAAIAAGVLKSEDILLLRDILADQRGTTRRDITVFKSVGHAAEDLVAVELLLARIHQAAH